ncbi:MAG: hypothetical protein KY475_11965 [Planctomycetes bacterium]|nr:hypothetical protein [Planctomycetota bacterium]
MSSTCSSCGASFQVSPQHAGQVVACPTCGAHVQTRGRIASPLNKAEVGVAWFLAVCCIGLGLMAAIQASDETNISRLDRFQSDNAMGATANAAEKIAERADNLHSGVAWVACGLLLVLIAQLVRVQAHLRHLVALREQELYGE